MELDNVVKKIEEGFCDPLESNDLEKFLKGTSKRVRSKLVLLYLQACGVNVPDDVYTILAVGEIIHNSSLLHDDVIDDAEFRRGEQTIGTKFGSKLSILGGDYLLVYAMEKLLGVNNSEVLGLFKDCTKKMIEGEFKQYYLRGKTPSIDEYIEICNLKTASLFVAMAECAAMLSGISVEQIKNFAGLFGVYFQIKNDLDSHSAELDKKNGINTAKDILGIEKAEILLDNYREEMRKILDELPDSVFKEELGVLFK